MISNSVSWGTLLQCRHSSLFNNSCYFVVFGSPSGHQLDHKEGAADHGPRHRRWTAGLRDHCRAKARLPGEQAEAWQPRHHLHTRYRESVCAFIPVWQELRPVLLFQSRHWPCSHIRWVFFFKEIPLKNVVTKSEFEALVRSVLVVFQPLVEPTKGVLK